MSRRDETASADVVVVGAGPAGLAAALSAAEAGCSVTVLDSDVEPGGTARWAVGSICLPATDDDPADAFLEDTAHHIGGYELSGSAQRLRTRFAAEAGSTRRWLLDHGVPLVGPHHEPPHRRARLFTLVPDGRALGWSLTAAAVRAGVVVRCGRTVTGLISDGDQQVVGVEHESAVDDDGGERTSAGCGVVVASGDFSGNAQLRREHLGEAAERAHVVNPANRGDHLGWLTDLGAVTEQMSTSFAPQIRFPALDQPVLAHHGATDLTAIGTAVMHRAHLAPDLALLDAGALLVGRHGGIIERHGAAAEVSRSGPATVVLDRRWLDGGVNVGMRISSAPTFGFANLAELRRGRPDLCTHAATVRDVLAHFGGIGASSQDLERRLSDMEAPFTLLSGAAATVTVTEGSVAVDEDLRVLRDGVVPIDGLRVAGAAGQGGQLLWGHGLHLAWALTSGRLAGASIVAARRRP